MIHDNRDGRHQRAGQQRHKRGKRPGPFTERVGPCFACGAELVRAEAIITDQVRCGPCYRSAATATTTLHPDEEERIMEGAITEEHRAGAALEHVDPNKLADSPLNPRKTYDLESIGRIVETAKDVGILETLMARPRPKGKGLELVFGHRRKRAAIQAGLETVPVLVREMTDREVRIAQLIENGQREDVPPLEEADGYQALVEQEGMTVPDVCAAVGRPASFVWRRLALTHLCDKGRKALEAGELRLGVAELVARLADPKAQAKAVKDLAGASRDGGLVTIAEAKRRIERDHLRDLTNVQFDPTDAELVPAAGSCADCPKRTGNNLDLFGDLPGKQTCTDGVCFAKKQAAHWKAASKAHKAEGGKVLGKAETKKAFPYQHHSSLGYGCGWIDLDAKRHGAKSYRRELKAAKVEVPPVVLAKDPNGATRHLVKQTDLDKALRKAGGGGKAKGASSSKPVMTPAEKKKAEADKRRAEVKRRTDRAMAKAVATSVTSEHLDDVGWWLTLARVVVRGSWHDTCKAACARRGLEIPKGKRGEDVLLEHAKDIASGEANPDCLTATARQLLAGLVLELASKVGAFPDSEGAGEVARYAGIKRAELKKAASKELTAERKAKATRKQETLANASRRKAKAKKTRKKTKAKA